MGQARKPSHVQRRFLQTSRSVSKPGEAAAVCGSDDVKPVQATWGRPGIGRPGVAGPGPSAAWGRPSGVGGIPARGPAGLGGIAPKTPVGDLRGKSQSGGNATEQSGASKAISPAPSPTQSDTPKAPDFLDAYEQRARNLMVARFAKEQQRPLGRHVGPGPQSNRAGRFEPRSREERHESAKREAARRFELENRGLGGDGNDAPKISRHVFDSDRPEPRRDNSSNTSQWGQLRIRRAKPFTSIGEREPPRPRDTRFEDSRAEREEQAKSGRYTPLSSRSINRDDPSRDPASRFYPMSDRRDRGEVEPRRRIEGARSIDLTAREFPERDTPEAPRVVMPIRDPSIPETVVKWSPFQDNSAPIKSNATLEAEREAELEARRIREAVAQHDAQRELERREEGEGSGRKKDRRRRGVTDEMDHSDLPKGKDRDKAKRRQQYARNEVDEDAEEEAAARMEAKAQRKKEKAALKAAQSAAPTPIFLPEYISVSNLAVALKVRYENFVRKMEELGFEDVSHDHILNAENAGLVAMEYNYEAIVERSESEDLRARDPAPDPSILPPRSPVVTIMGHVDHGKTTILDFLRKSSVAATEHGGITQHIGAFSVPLSSGKVITFLDTPGHAAFLNMRQRGANVTDIVILVVAADDSVKPQTIEAINHAKAAKVPIIVAINKIDKHDTDIDRVKQDLARHGVDVEDYGGDTQVVCVSGKTGQGMPDLEEAAATLSEILDMRAERDGPAEGWVLEASIKSMGKVATVLVRRGTMRPGDFIVAGNTWARIRCLRNEAGVEIDEAGPGTPVEIDGWREQPLAGDEVLQAPDETKAKSVVEFRLEKLERDKLAEDMEAINENRKAEQEKREREKEEAAALAEAMANDEEAPEKRAAKASGPKQIYFVVKGDVSGSVEAVIDSVSVLGNGEVQPSILRSGVGQISEFDIEHAAAAKGHIINFNTVVDPGIAGLAARAKVSILDHNIIYRLVDDVKAELSKHLPPLVTQRVLGEAEISKIFEINIKGRQHKAVAGCKVRNGTVSKTAKIRVLRGGEKVYDGKSQSFLTRIYNILTNIQVFCLLSRTSRKTFPSPRKEQNVVWASKTGPISWLVIKSSRTRRRKRRDTCSFIMFRLVHIESNPPRRATCGISGSLRKIFT